MVKIFNINEIQTLEKLRKKKSQRNKIHVLFFVPRIFYFFKITAAEIMFPFLTIFLSHILYLMTKMEVSGRVTLKWVDGLYF